MIVRTVVQKAVTVSIKRNHYHRIPRNSKRVLFGELTQRGCDICHVGEMAVMFEWYADTEVIVEEVKCIRW